MKSRTSFCRRVRATAHYGRIKGEMSRGNCGSVVLQHLDADTIRPFDKREPQLAPRERARLGPHPQPIPLYAGEPRLETAHTKSEVNVRMALARIHSTPILPHL